MANESEAMDSALDVRDDRRLVIDLEGLDGILRSLGSDGYRVIGPTHRDGAIVLDEISGVGDLPTGWRDEQDAGTYRLEQRGDGAVFGSVVGPDSPKRYLHPATATIWSGEREGDGYRQTEPEAPPRFAFVGLRPCELAAIAMHDRVFLEGLGRDRTYATRRDGIFVVAVNCIEPGGTCFCASMGTGPSATSGFDLALTEVPGDGEHRFVVTVGSDAGAGVLEHLGGSAREATPQERAAEADLLGSAASAMGRMLETEGLRDLLYANLESPLWDRIAERCLLCANCTLACPTCFCATVEDRLDLEGTHAERVRTWDSCFIADFSYIHGGSLRTGGAARYRQWMTHKLASWVDQFGTFGCVGCGRCITWCPVGIDITAEAAAIRKADIRLIEEVPA